MLIGPLRFDEEVTAFERPSRMDYLIVKLNAPFEHKGGTMRLSEEDGGTRVEWTTEFGIPVPVVGAVQEWIWGPDSALRLPAGARRRRAHPDPVTAFMTPDLFPLFGLPDALPR